MSPSLSDDKADIILQADSRLALFIEEDIENYHRGNRVGFNATINVNLLNLSL